MPQTDLQRTIAKARALPQLSKARRVSHHRHLVVPSLFQFYLILLRPWSQTLSFAVACAAIAPVLSLGATSPMESAGRPRCLLACLRMCHQVTQVMALFYMGPGVYAIFTRSSVIFTALLALISFPEERYVIRQWQFQVGTVLGLIALWRDFGFKPACTPEPSSGRALIAFTATFCWPLGIFVKRPPRGWVRSQFRLISFITSTLLLPPHFPVWQNRYAAPSRDLGEPVLIVSALSCSDRHVFYYVAIREIAWRSRQTLQLLCPIGALRFRPDLP